ncbi:hypothetical protein D7030_04455 [Flavobacteriaceae bacterium AU392]|nr:hypothetical protein D1817_10930 [Flavobacteriaceae bacterium]RKM85929.1 hypothetical protein D7030_04455 [Flavobacteriaceae bacterium AU392]
MKQIGIWINKDKAFIIDNNRDTMITISSNIEHFHIHGGSGTRFKGGPQDVVQDSKYLEREKHQLRVYFKDIISHINNESHIIIFGPAEAGMMFLKALEKINKTIYKNVLNIVKTDFMTPNQLKAWVRDFYKSKTENEV